MNEVLTRLRSGLRIAANDRYIAVATAHLGAVLDEVERLRAENERLQAELHEMRVRAVRVRKLCNGPRLQETAEILRALDRPQ